MDDFELKDFNKRIELNTDLENLSKIICEKYCLGNFISNELIEIGYEDYNYYLTTTNGKYCVKIFNKERNSQNIKNYLERIKAVADSKVNSPKPLKINDEILFSLDYCDNHYDLCVFEYINGKNFFELKTTPSDDIIKEIAKQTAQINNLDIRPAFIYDSWAIINFLEEFNKKREYVSEKYKTEFDILVERLEKIDMGKLPKGFVHGDIISTNVMIDENKRIWIIDYAVSNYLPRIIDLAVISCNLCLDRFSKEKTFDNITLLLSEYNKYNKLTEYELEVFSVFYQLANAMHIIQTQYIAKVDSDSEENQYWLNEGITGYSYGKEIFCKKLLK